jgi:hypothetical protein
VLLGVLLAGLIAAKKGPQRYGIEGVLVSYDEGRDVAVVRVVNTKVTGGFGTGGIAGDPAPSSVKSGSELEFQVVPEGSVLRRTIIKGQRGGGLDNSGTKEGFKRALAVVPKDRPVVISFEENKGGSPAYTIKLVQIRLSEEEIRARLRELGMEDLAEEGASPEGAAQEAGGSQ